jgi:hypothetical protein
MTFLSFTILFPFIYISSTHKLPEFCIGQLLATKHTANITSDQAWLSTLPESRLFVENDGSFRLKLSNSDPTSILGYLYM